jgi:beta-ureidopropionase
MLLGSGSRRTLGGKRQQEDAMPRIVRCGLIQAQCEWSPEKFSLADIKEKMIVKHEKLIAEAGKKGVQVLGLQELFYGPYFCAEQEAKWYELTERVPDGPTLKRMQKLAKKYRMVLIVPIYEVEMTGVFYNTAAVFNSDGTYLGKYRKHHIPHCHPGFWEKFYFTPGNAGYPVFETSVGKVGVYICYDRHFPEGARILGLNGAEIVFNPSATVAGLSEYLWQLEQPAHAVANQYFVAAINRVGTEKPWNIGEFYGKSYFCDPRGKIVAQAVRDKDQLLVSDLDFDLIKEVRSVWQFYRDRRPESYDEIVRTLRPGAAQAAD